MDAMNSQYELSKHFYGNTSARNTKWCARCHTSDGFLEILSKPVTATSLVVANDIPNATRITCATCHKHSSFSFSGDTALYVLRTTTPVNLEYNKLNATKFLAGTDYGKIDNLCATCHQIRGVSSANTTLPFFPLDNTKEATTVQYRQGQSFAVHDGNQANLNAGINGYEFAGKTYPKTWKHAAYSCIDCHMNTYDPATKKGGHTLIVNTAKCVACHVLTSPTDKIAVTQAAITAKLAELGAALTAKKVFKSTTNSSGVVSYSAVATHDYAGVLYANTPNAILYTSVSALTTVSATTGLVVYGTTTTTGLDTDVASRIGREWKYGELGAAYNYGYINSELSLGVHNPPYAMAILQTSIDFLKSY